MLRILTDPKSKADDLVFIKIAMPSPGKVPKKQDEGVHPK